MAYIVSPNPHIHAAVSTKRLMLDVIIALCPAVIVSFLFGALFFHEHNLKSKALDLALVVLGMLCLYIGSK